MDDELVAITEAAGTAVVGNSSRFNELTEPSVTDAESDALNPCPVAALKLWFILAINLSNVLYVDNGTLTLTVDTELRVDVSVSVPETRAAVAVVLAVVADDPVKYSSLIG